jgi:hypothetical protein
MFLNGTIAWGKKILAHSKIHMLTNLQKEK